MTEFGEPITTEQAVRAILGLLDTPIVGDLTLYSRAGTALTYCKKDEVYSLLSSGEKRIVNIAYSVWKMDETIGPSVVALSGLDRDKRRKVWMILGYLYLGRDLGWNEIDYDFSKYRRD